MCKSVLYECVIIRSVFVVEKKGEFVFCINALRSTFCIIFQDNAYLWVIYYIVA